MLWQRPVLERTTFILPKCDIEVKTYFRYASCFYGWLLFWRCVPNQETDELTMGSLFDGIGDFPLAAVRNGIRLVWASEIEAFPIAVTKLRCPQHGSCRGHHKAERSRATASKYHMWGQPLSGSLGGRSQSRSGRCAFRPFYGTGQTHKGDEERRRITRQSSYRYTTSIHGVGERSRSLLQWNAKRRRLPVCPRGDRPN